MNFNIAFNFFSRLTSIIDAFDYMKLNLDLFENNVIIAKCHQMLFHVEFSDNSTSDTFHENQERLNDIIEDIFFEIRTVVTILQNDEVGLEMERLYNEWMDVLDNNVYPLRDKIFLIFTEIDEHPNSDEMIRLHCINVELQTLIEVFEECIQVFRISLLQIMYADHCYSRGYYPNEVDQIEE